MYMVIGKERRVLVEMVARREAGGCDCEVSVVRAYRRACRREDEQWAKGTSRITQRSWMSDEIREAS